MNSPHIVRKTTSPISAPPEAGIHWINTVTKEEFFSVGTGSINDWIKRSITRTADSLVTTVWNQTGVNIPQFSVVYINGSQGTYPTVALAQSNAEATSSGTYGITIAAIPNNSQGTVVPFGMVEGINTNGFTDGDKLWLSPTVAGGVTTTKPSAPNHIVYVATVTRAHPSNGRVEVRISNGYELEELHNVAISSPSNGQTITYNSSTQLWNNHTITKSDLGLGNVDNTSDADKPISTSTQTALNLKEDVANKSTSTSLGSSNTLYPSQNAVKTYVDTGLGSKQDTITGAASSATTSNFTTNKIMVTDGFGKIAASSVDSNNVNYLDATSSIQTQINSKAASSDVLKKDGSVALTGDLNLGTHKITNVVDPSSNQDAATKFYVDNLVSGLDWKQACHVASVANVNIASAPSSIDGHAFINSERILLKDQSTASENGIYVFNGTGNALTRATDADTWNEIVGAVVYIEQGSINGGSKWNCTNISGGTLGVTAINFTLFSSASSISGVGNTNYNAYWTGSNVLSSEQYVATSRGGLGTDSSAFSGVVKSSAGSFSASSIVDSDISAIAAIDASKIGSGTVSNTEFGYLDGLSGSVQTQINGKVSKSGDTMTGSLGIGVTNRISPLHVSSVDKTVSPTMYTSDYIALSAENTAPGFNIITSSDTSGHRGVFKSTRSRGTLDAPTAVQSGDQTFSLVGAGHDGTTNITTAGITFAVDGTVATNQVPQAITFATGNGATRTERMRINSTGQVGINFVPSAASSPLTVKSTAVPSTAESIASFFVTDSSASLNISNASTVDGTFVPSLAFTQATGNNINASMYQGFITLSDDTGTSPIHVFRAQTQNSGVYAPVSTRPLYDWRNWSTSMMTMLANGNLGLGYTSPSEKLNVNGNILSSGTVLGSNLSGTNTGDETTATIKTKLGSASSTQDGYLTSADWTTFNGKQAAIGYTPVNKAGDTMTGTLQVPTVKSDVINNKTSTDFYIQTTEASAGAGTEMMYVKSGDSISSTGSVWVQSGNGDNTGQLSLKTGNHSGSAGLSGLIQIKSGDSTAGTADTGGITLNTGSTTSGNSGQILIVSGTAPSGTRGAISLDSPNIKLNGWSLKQVGEPSSSTDAATKNYVDTGLALKEDLAFIPKISGIETYRGALYQNNSTTVTTENIAALLTNGTATARSVANTNQLTKRVRMAYAVSTPAANAICGVRSSNMLWSIGSGFKMSFSFAYTDSSLNTGARQFYGMHSLTGGITISSTVTVDSLTNMFCIGSDAADTSLCIFYNDGTGTASKIVLGATDFPANRGASASTDIFSVDFYNELGSSSIKYKVTNLTTLVSAQGTLITDLPASSTLLTFQAIRTSGSSSNACSMDLTKFGVWSTT